MSHNPLGKTTSYKSTYDPKLLFPIPRSANRTVAGINASLFLGYDIWNAYELSWLNAKGKPETARLQIVYSSSSEFIVESKSLKLYLNSFNMSVFTSSEELRAAIHRDLSAILNTPELNVTVYTQSDHFNLQTIPDHQLLDNLDIACTEYSVNSSLLVAEDLNKENDEIFYSNLLRTNCPVTGQPDWATIQISLKGAKTVRQDSLLRYIVSYRDHSDYHETCCEKIFADLLALLNPKELTVKCFFTRRGGIDINPCRFYGIKPDSLFNLKFWRQ